ncbi:MAG TPA: hypothetical protein PKI93_03940 [Alphaproteobacteria bacterium]|nr:hypothetical protein [Alphaproteobacteria bacterium]HNS43866.1 hypothetical protein [Alphaproteobacteria bacterium]
MRRYSEHGSALILVLIITMIFAALSYAVTQGLRVSEGTSNAVNQDKAQLEATSVLNFVQSVRSAVQEMKVSSGGASSSVDFVIPGDEPAYSTSPHTMKIFHPQGGKVTYIPVWATLDDPTEATTTEWNFLSNSVDGIGGSGTELLMTLIAVPEATCKELNRSLTGSDTVPSESGDILAMFKTGANAVSAANCAACEGKMGLCVGNGNLRAFYFVLDRG